MDQWIRQGAGGISAYHAILAKGGCGKILFDTQSATAAVVAIFAAMEYCLCVHSCSMCY
jgi:hypothetical protein